jgi:heavy metal translocating P-type ATPase
MNVMAFTMALWSTEIYDFQQTDNISLPLVNFFRSASMLFALPVFFLLGRPLLENALETASRGIFSTDLILSAGVVASFVYSAFSVIQGQGPIYFEVGCVVLVMVTLGRWLEATGKTKAGDALDKLAKLMPPTVHLLRSGEEVEIPTTEVAQFDLLRVRAGERFPVDGRIQEGQAYVDEQVFTGESRPSLRSVGSVVLGGTVNLDGDLLVETTATSTSGTLDRLITLVRDARRAKGRYEKLVDLVSTWFLPAITLIALGTFGYHTVTSGLEQGMLQALAVVLIACPCALGLATPLAVWSSLSRAAEAGVIFRSGEAIEQLATVKAVCFDKTGTLTTGEPRLTEIVCDDQDREAVFQTAALLTGSSHHILARAIFNAISPTYTTQGRRPEIRLLAGRGISASIEDADALRFLGSRRLMEEQGLTFSATIRSQADASEGSGSSVSFLGWEGHVRALFVFEEELRVNTKVTVDRCRDLEIRVTVLTGDHQRRGDLLAADLGIPVLAALLPDGKVGALQAIRKQYGPVAMVGDGVNDAPALMESDVGIAMGCGADLSRDSAVVCLLGDDVLRVPWAIELARRTVSTIRYNLFWAFGYNAVGVFLAAAGRLSPSIAAFLMVGSSLFVIANSLRLLGHDRRLDQNSLTIPELKAVTA